MADVKPATDEEVVNWRIIGAGWMTEAMFTSVFARIDSEVAARKAAEERAERAKSAILTPGQYDELALFVERHGNLNHLTFALTAEVLREKARFVREVLNA